MRFFSSLCSGITNIVSSVASSVKNAASTVWEGTKSVAKKVMETASDIGGKVVDTVKNVFTSVKDTAKKLYEKGKEVVKQVAQKVYETGKEVYEKGKEIYQKAKVVYQEKVKPYLTAIKHTARIIGNTVGAYYPWVKVVATAIEKGIAFLEKLEKHPLVKKVTNAIDWALNKIDHIVKQAKKIKDIVLTKSEEQEAVQRQQDLAQAYSLMKTEEQRNSVRFTMLINDFLLVKTRIEQALESFETSESTNFDHFLRLRATRKLLRVTERRLIHATDLTQITDDDIFLIRTGADLLAEKPTLSEADGLRLDKIIRRRFNGKSLLPFVFEELIASWTTKYRSMEHQWERMNKSLAEQKRKLKQLQIQDRIEGLTGEQVKELSELQEQIREGKYELDEQAAKNRAISKYIYASEGFLQVLEKSEEYWADNGREYIIEDSAEIGMLLIQCMERQSHWDDLTEDQQSLINDFANMFEEESKTRQAEWIVDDVSELEELEIIEVAA